MRKFLTMAAFAVMATVTMPDAGMAQITGNAPYCVRIYTSSNTRERCEYASFEHCQAFNDGRNNTCFANPYFQPGPPLARRR